MSEITNRYLRVVKGLRVRHGTITADQQAIDVTATWNSGGTTFTAIKANITNTASAAASKLIDLQVGGVTQFSVTRAGVGALTGAFSVGGLITASLGVKVGGGSFAKATVYDGGDGLRIAGNQGTTYEFGIVRADGSAIIMAVTKDTNNVTWATGSHTFAGGVSGITTLATSGAATLASLIISGLSATAVSAGAADSAGAGFRLLRIPN